MYNVSSLWCCVENGVAAEEKRRKKEKNISRSIIVTLSDVGKMSLLAKLLCLLAACSVSAWRLENRPVVMVAWWALLSCCIEEKNMCVPCDGGGSVFERKTWLADRREDRRHVVSDEDWLKERREELLCVTDHGCSWVSEGRENKQSNEKEKSIAWEKLQCVGKTRKLALLFVWRREEGRRKKRSGVTSSYYYSSVYYVFWCLSLAFSMRKGISYTKQTASFVSYSVWKQNNLSGRLGRIYARMMKKEEYIERK